MKSFLFPKALSVWSGSGLMATPQWRATLVIMTNKHVIRCTMNDVNISIAEAPCRVPDWSTACCSAAAYSWFILSANQRSRSWHLFPCCTNSVAAQRRWGALMYVGARLGVAYCRRMVPTPTPTVAAGYRATDATGDEIKTWVPPRPPRYNVNHFSKKHSFDGGRGRLIITNGNGHTVVWNSNAG